MGLWERLGLALRAMVHDLFDEESYHPPLNPELEALQKKAQAVLKNLENALAAALVRQKKAEQAHKQAPQDEVLAEQYQAYVQTSQQLDQEISRLRQQLTKMKQQFVHLDEREKNVISREQLNQWQREFGPMLARLEEELTGRNETIARREDKVSAREALEAMKRRLGE